MAGPLRLFLPCAAGVDALLLDEVVRLLPGSAVRSGRGGIALATDAAGMMKVNLGSRLAQRVLLELAAAPYRDEADLYALARRIDDVALWKPDESSPLEGFPKNWVR